MYILLLAVLLLVGCVDNNQPSKNQNNKFQNQPIESGGINIISEQNRTEIDTTPVQNRTQGGIRWGDSSEQKEEDVMNYTFSSYDPLIIKFFNVGFREKQGRLILLRLGTSDVYIWGVPQETYPQAYGYIRSHSDDIEFVIVPSARPVNLETLSKLRQDFRIGKTIAPRGITEYTNETFDIYLKEGDVLEIGNYKIQVIQAGKDYLKNPGDMSLVLRVSKGDKCILMLLDIETGGLQRLNIDHSKRFSCEYFQWNAYGIYFIPDLYINFFNDFRPKYMIADGAKFDTYDEGTRSGIYQRAGIYRVNVTRVWENESTTIIFE
ncbi:MAG: hypothetical protein NZ908_00640 [Candidatus Micrarchaeota archaeon]|nr:hypothetical protein [Candidatus Micrarchaeota archaeon]